MGLNIHATEILKAIISVSTTLLACKVYFSAHQKSCNMEGFSTR